MLKIYALIVANQPVIKISQQKNTQNEEKKHRRRRHTNTLSLDMKLHFVMHVNWLCFISYSLMRSSTNWFSFSSIYWIFFSRTIEKVTDFTILMFVVIHISRNFTTIANRLSQFYLISERSTTIHWQWEGRKMVNLLAENLFRARGCRVCVFAVCIGRDGEKQLLSLISWRRVKTFWQFPHF